MFKIIKMSDNTKDYIEAYYMIFEEMKSKMESVIPGNSISQNFINRMIPHHEAAISMAENILKYTTNIEIEEIAKTIIKEQSEDIATMKTLKETCTEENNSRDMFLYEKGYLDAFNKMIQGMSNAQTGNNVNVDFLTEMIPHHEGAINMAKNLLKFEVCEPLRTLAENIVTSQTSQAEEMKTLLRKLY